MNPVLTSTAVRFCSAPRLLIALAIFLCGAFCGCAIPRSFAHNQDYTLQLIAPGGGAFVLSQKTGRVYAVEAFGQAEYVADISAWDKDDTLRPGTQLRADREAVISTRSAQWFAPDVPSQNAPPGQ